MHRHLIPAFATGLLVLSAACATPKGATAPDRRSYVLDMRDDTLAELYSRRPGSQAVVESATGYAVFSNVGINLIFAAVGQGYGVLEEQSGRRTYMRMGELGLGIGLGVKDFRAVFVFRNASVMRRFRDSGWEFSADADAAAKVEDRGGAVSGSANTDSITDDILIYQFTKHGIALQATVSGTKYWKDADLNR